MKIALFTLNGYWNYGNRLQNYATEQFLMEFGADVETVLVALPQRALPQERSIMEQLPSIIRKLKNFCSELFRIVLRRSKQLFLFAMLGFKDVDNIRYYVFEQFSKEFLHEKQFGIVLGEQPDSFDWSEYDYLGTGSDQVWNPEYNDKYAFGDYPSIYLLPFSNPECKFSISASIAVSYEKFNSYEEKITERYRKWISEISHISVREREGADIVRSLTGKEATVLVDPTMLLSRSKWLSFSKKPPLKNISGDYTVTYFLGKRKRINSLEMPVIALNDLRQPKAFVIDPCQWVWLIAHAKLVYTDSFHAAVFSIIFHVPFVVLQRKDADQDMSSRITTLLSRFGLDNRFGEVSSDDLLNVDFSNTDEILESGRQNAFDFFSFINSDKNKGEAEQF